MAKKAAERDMANMESRRDPAAREDVAGAGLADS